MRLVGCYTYTSAKRGEYFKHFRKNLFLHLRFSGTPVPVQGIWFFGWMVSGCSFRFAFAKLALKRAIMVPVESKVVCKNIVVKIKIQNCLILGILYLAMVAKKKLVFRQARWAYARLQNSLNSCISGVVGGLTPCNSSANRMRASWMLSLPLGA